MKKPLTILALLAATTALTACTPPFQQRDLFLEQPQHTATKESLDPVAGWSPPPVVYVERRNYLTPRAAVASDPWPLVTYDAALELPRVPLLAALESLLRPEGIGLSWEGDLQERMISIRGMGGSLRERVERICELGQVFCRLRNGTLEVQSTMTFTVPVPAFPEEVLSDLVSSIGDLTGEGARLLDGAFITYRATTEGQAEVKRYLSAIGHERPLITAQIYVWEVRLDDSNQTGIDWTRLAGSIGSVGLSLTGPTTAVNGAIGIGVNYTGDDVSADALFKFLRTQGAVRTVSQPKLHWLSGTAARLKDGGVFRYLARVGDVVNGSDDDDNRLGLGTNTASLDEIDIGLELEISGGYYDGLVSGAIELTTNEVRSVTSIPTGTTTIQAPETADRELETRYLARPGDTVILGGIISSRDEYDLDGMPLPIDGVLPTRRAKETQNTELVVMIQPSLIVYTDNPAKLAARVSDPDTTMPVPESENGGIGPMNLLPPPQAGEGGNG